MEMTSISMRALGLRPFALALAVLAADTAHAGPLNLSSNPLFLMSNAIPNVLVLFGNANSMDEAPSGAAVGSNNAASKSEIARNAIKSMISQYQGVINMGLMAYQQNTAGLYNLYNSQYDVSYDPADYDPNYTGPRNGRTKKFRLQNPTDTGNYIYYNVDLPFYDTSSLGNAFMYSSTACTSPTRDFYGVYASGACTNTIETVTGNVGPWDSYNLYRTKTGTSNAAPGATGAGYSSFFGFGAFYPSTSDLAQGITDFGVHQAWQQVGQAWFANSSPGKGYVHKQAALLNATQSNALNVKLGTEQFSQNKPVDPNYPLQNSGLAPLEGSVMTANNYFNGSLSAPAQGGPLPAPPNSCGKNFFVMLTDGLPSVTQNGTPSSDVSANLLAVTTQVGALLASPATVKTYMMGFSLPYGVNPAQLDTIAAAGGTGSSYYATDPASLNSAFSSVFADILARTASSASLAANSTSLNNGTKIFQARFNSGDWSGQLSAYAVNSAGAVNTTSTWDASTQLDALDPTQRVILTYDDATDSLNGGIAFRWDSLPASYQASLQTDDTGTLNTTAVAQSRLDWLRGVRTNEGTAAGQLRVRSTVLGDIINSNPVYVGKPGIGLTDTGYVAFVHTYQDRERMVYVAANDAMLHGFDAGTGVEKLAYVPSSVIHSAASPSSVPAGNLSHLATQPYSAHRYYVDDSPVSSDAKFGSPAHWGTILVGGLGDGGRGIYALDVTDPSTFSEANAASLVLWEFNSDVDPDLGYTFGQPSILRMANGRWAAVFGNGYNSANNQAFLFIVFLDRAPGRKTWVNGTDYIKIATGVGSASLTNGLSTPLATDTDSNGYVDYIYAGDIRGNMWKFDVRSATPANWGSRFGAGVPLYTASSSTGTVQPIVAAPEVVRNPAGGFNVLFGTGMYLQSGTLDTANMNVQSFYSIWDDNSDTPAATGRSVLQQQSILQESTVNGANYRLTSASTVSYPTQKGWYMDLLTPPTPTAQGERSVYRPLARNGRIIFTTLIPSTVMCSYGGNSWLMELDALNGSRLTVSPFDVTGDGTFTSADFITLNGVAVAVSGRGSAIGITPTPTVIKSTQNSNKEFKISSGTSGNTESVSENATGSSGRLSWRQIMH